MNSIENILDTIKKLRKDNQTFFVAIDGFGGSGKSTLAKELQKQLQPMAETTIVEIDDFYSPKLKTTDRQRLLDQVLLPLKNNKPATYQIYNWGKEMLGDWKKVRPHGIVIIEGIPSMHPDFGVHNLTIWIDYPQEEAAKRGIHRDLNVYKVDNKTQWENDWMPQEKAYVEKYNPKSKADIVIC